MKPNRKFALIIMSPLIGALIPLGVFFAVEFALPLTASEMEILAFTPPAVNVLQRQPRSTSGLTCPVQTALVQPEQTAPALFADPAPQHQAAEKTASKDDNKISLILIDEALRMAIIDGAVVREGDCLQKSSVARIEKDKVLLKNARGEQWLRMD